MLKITGRAPSSLPPSYVLTLPPSAPPTPVSAGRRNLVTTVRTVGSLYRGCLGAAGGASLAMAFYFGFYGATTRVRGQRGGGRG